MKNLCFRICGLVLFFAAAVLLATASPAFSQSSASYKVTAQVPSNVSEKNSTVKLNVDQALADPVNHPILLTVTLKDESGNPLSGKRVKVTSDRGVADIIEATSKVSSFHAQAADIGGMQTDETNDNGIASFRITSFIPGEATFKTIADNIVPLAEQKITFLPLPIPSYLSLSVDLPSTARELIIIPEKFKQRT